MPRIFPTTVRRTVVVGGGGPNPSDAFSIGIRLAETNPELFDAMSLAFGFPDSLGAQSDLLQLGLALAEANPELSDLLLSIGLGLIDTSPAIDDALALAVALTLADTNATPDELTQLAIAGFDDTNVAPTDARGAIAKFWGTGSAGAGVTNPTNANAPNNGTTATVSTAPAGAATETLTSNCGNAFPSGTARTSIIFHGWYRLRTTLATSTAKVVIHSSSAIFADITIETLSAVNGDNNHLTTEFISADLTPTINTNAKLQSAQIQYITTDAVAGVSPAIIDADAGSLWVTGVLN